MGILLEPTSNKLLVERFDTTSGNPVKEILLKLNLPVHRSILTDSKDTSRWSVKAKAERKSLALKAKKESRYEECLTSRSEDEEYAMTVKDFKKFFKRKVNSYDDPNLLIGECPKPPKDKNQRDFFGGSWSDSSEEDDEKVKNEAYLVAQASSVNVDFMSANNTSSTNDVSTAYSVSSPSVLKSQKEGSSSYTDEVIYSFFANQSSAPQLDYDDFEQINDDDMEEIDLKWQVAMISMRIKKFYKRTGRKLQFDTKDPISFDKTKSGHVEEDAQNYAMIAYFSSNSSSDNEVKSCSKTYEESYARLKKWYDEQRNQLGDASVEITTYTLALRKVEAQLLCHQQNQLAYEQKIRFMKIDLDDKTDVLAYDKKLLVETHKEKEDLKTKFENWQNSSKNLSRLLNTQMSANDKFGLGYGDYRYGSILSYKNEVLQSVFMNKESDLENTSVNDRYAAGMHVVPPTMTGNYMPSGPDVEIDYSKFTYETPTSMPAPVENAPKVVCKPKVWTDAPIIEEENVKDSNTPNHSPKIRKQGINGHTRKGLGYAFTRKACFVCGSFNHLIIDCDFHENRMAKQAVLTKSKDKDDPHRALKDKGIVDGGCSMHMTGNKAYLADYQEFKGDSVAFRGSNGRITGRGKIKAGKLDFEDVYYVEELKNYNLFFVSQMCDKNNKAEVVNTACYVLNRVLVTKPQNKTPYELLTGFLVGYSLNSKAFRAYNLETKRVKEKLHVNFLENKPNVVGKGHAWMFDLDYLTNSMNYEHVLVENQANKFAGSKEANNIAGTQANDDQSANSEDEHFVLQDQANDEHFDQKKLTIVQEIDIHDEHFVLPIWSAYSTTVKSSGDKIEKNTDCKTCEKPVSQVEQIFLEELEKLKRQEKEANDATESPRKEATHNIQSANTNNINLLNSVSTPISTAGPSRAFNDVEPLYPDDPSMPYLEDIYASPSEGIFTDSSYDDEDPKFPNKVYKVVKALFGLHQAHRAWYATLSTFLEKSRYKKGAIDKTLFIKQDKKDIMLVQVYVDDIIFGLTKKSWCHEFKELIKNRFQMSSMGELTFFLELQVKQKEDGIFISHDKYVAKILKKFDFPSVKTASTPIETQKPLVKDKEAADVDIHLYRSMIGSLMYLPASRPDIMFAVYACSRFQVTPKTSHLQAMKKVFRYLKGQPKLGLWYPKVSSFDLEAYSDSDYASANLDMKSTTRGCQFLGRRLISWQCKKQTIVATSTTETEYVAAAHCYKQMAFGKDFLNPLMADNLPKIIRKKLVVTEDFLPRDLRLDNADGVECLPNEEIFTELACMGYEKPPPKLTFYMAFFSAQWKFLIHTLVQCVSAKNTAWNEFSCLMASAIICLAIGRKFNFSKVGKGFSRVETPLFATMLVQPQAKVEEDKVAVPNAPTPPSLTTAPSPPPQNPITTPPQAQPATPSSPPHGRKNDNNAAIKDVSVVEPTVFNDEEVTMTMAQTLIKMKAKKQDSLMSRWLKEKHLDNTRKYQSLKRKPIYIAQAKKNMIVYLKNMVGYKMEHFRGMTYDKTLLQESFKKLKAVEVSVSEFNVEALQVKYPLIDWEIHSEGSRSYWKIIRVGGITEAYQSFEDMLKGFDREDMDAL
uniref:Uncharacterized mitochondrial protein AtMg00810-like n=1 Tax=Tanacetum cinerariifolium TaxID=118510 RepID=A0A6L2JR24_TANCI|nr:uncharacterized mitochondrial protein AtMg00810-like [Tanacetum cinerariifolium]